MNKKITMEYIAQEMGITKSTVSKALSGKSDISDLLKNEILQKAKELNYNKAPFYHIVVFSASRYFGTDTSYYQILFNMLNDTLHAMGHTCTLKIISQTEENVGFQLSISEVMTADGLIVMGKLDYEWIESVQALELPIILLDHYTNKLKIDWVTPNDYFNAYVMTDFLIARGHTDIGFCGNTYLTSGMQDRFLGYQKALLDNDISFRAEWLINDRADDGGDIPLVLPDSLPTAYLCLCDKTAYRLIKVLSAANVRIPQEISVVSFDDTDYSKLCEPQITTISVDKKDLVDRCISLIIKKIRNPQYHENAFIIGTIIVRKSC